MVFGGFVRIKVASGPPAPVVDGIQLARDAAVLIVCTLLVPVLRYFLHVLVYEPAARAILRVPPPPPLPAPKNKKKTQQKSSSKGGAAAAAAAALNTSSSSSSTTIAQRARAAAELARASDPRQKLVARFTESAWKLSVYVFLLLLGAWAIGGEPWSGVLTALPGGGGFGSGKGSGKRGATATAANAAAAAADALWLGWPLAAPPLRLSLYYLAEGAFYLASLFMLLHWEVKRKDFAAMLTHHVATALLITGSRALRFERVGSLVMALHDPSDVLLEAAKLASYAGFERGAAALFAVLAGSWAALRLWALPLRVMRSVAFDAPRVLGGSPWGSRQLNGALFVLWCLHCYWFALIVRVAWAQLTSGRLRDAREEEEEEDGVEEREKVERSRSRSRRRSSSRSRRK